MPKLDAASGILTAQFLSIALALLVYSVQHRKLRGLLSDSPNELGKLGAEVLEELLEYCGEGECRIVKIARNTIWPFLVKKPDPNTIYIIGRSWSEGTDVWSAYMAAKVCANFASRPLRIAVTRKFAGAIFLAMALPGAALFCRCFGIFVNMEVCMGCFFLIGSLGSVGLVQVVLLQFKAERAAVGLLVLKGLVRENDERSIGSMLRSQKCERNRSIAMVAEFSFVLALCAFNMFI